MHGGDIGSGLTWPKSGLWYLVKQSRSSLEIMLCRFPNTLESERATIVSPTSVVLTKERP